MGCWRLGGWNAMAQRRQGFGSQAESWGRSGFLRMGVATDRTAMRSKRRDRTLAQIEGLDFAGAAWGQRVRMWTVRRDSGRVGFGGFGSADVGAGGFGDMRSWASGTGSVALGGNVDWETPGWKACLKPGLDCLGWLARLECWPMTDKQYTGPRGLLKIEAPDDGETTRKIVTALEAEFGGKVDVEIQAGSKHRLVSAVCPPSWGVTNDKGESLGAQGMHSRAMYVMEQILGDRFVL
eukprot:gene48551-59454_t